MKYKTIIPAVCAVFAITGASVADAQSKKKQRRNQEPAAASMSVGAGTAQAGRRGAESSGVIGSTARTTGCVAAPNTATTLSTGAAYTDRRTASAAGTTGGTASGSGSVSATSDSDVYASTSKSGSDAGAIGYSTANADEASRRPRC